MARQRKTVTIDGSSTPLSPATAGANKSIALIDQEMAKEVANLKSQIGQASGNKISVESTGNFKLPDGLDLGDEIHVVVIDFVSRNNFYSIPFNRDNPAPPDCYAIGKVIAEMAPEDDSPSPQNELCASCPLNQFGSGNGGRGKACSNRRLLAVVLVDPEDPDASAAADAPIYTLDLPPTAIKSFDGAASYVARALAGPPVKAVLTVTAKPVGTYAAISFSDPVPNPHYAVHYARRGEVQDMLFRKPDFATYEAKKPARRPAAPARRSIARR